MAHITINFSNVTVSSSNTGVLLSGATFGLDVAEGLSISGTVSFNSMYVTIGAINFNVASGTLFNASLEAIVIASSPGRDPSVEVPNFEGTCTVTWPTLTGLQTQTLESSNPLTLTGYAG